MPRRALSPAGLLAEFSGLIDLKVTASDGTLSVTDTFTLTITPTNDAPVVAAPIADQHMAEDTQWTFQVPVGTFDDIDSTGLTYTAILANGATLPFWLTFDVSTRTFSGTPPRDFNGSLDLKITASDGSLSAFDIFTLTIDLVNDAPVVRAPVVDATILEEAPSDLPGSGGNFRGRRQQPVRHRDPCQRNGTAVLASLRFDDSHVLRHAASGFQRHRRSQEDRKRRLAERLRHLHAEHHGRRQSAYIGRTDHRPDGGRRYAVVVPGARQCVHRFRQLRSGLYGEPRRWISAAAMAALR